MPGVFSEHGYEHAANGQHDGQLGDNPLGWKKRFP